MYYTKNDINNLKVTGDYYMPDALLKDPKYKKVRLETKLAYAALLNTAIKNAKEDESGNIYVVGNDPLNVEYLHLIANKKVDQDKIDGYVDELDHAGLVDKLGNSIYLLKD